MKAPGVDSRAAQNNPVTLDLTSYFAILAQGFRCFARCQPLFRPMSDSILRLQAPAKINLWLRILGRREDGFHEIETRMCRVGVCDEVIVEKRTDTEVHLTCSDASIPCDESNLAIRAVRAFEQRTGDQRGYNIHLEKQIPYGAGLGGGSSDAAAVLEALNTLNSAPLSLTELCEAAASLGSDIPFFLHKKTCDATGRGEQVVSVDFPWRLPLVLIKPPFGIPTPWAYQRWAVSHELKGIRYAAQPCEWGAMMNDLERPVFEKYTMLPALKSWLLEQPETRAALMSGSGSTMYAITHDATTAAALAKKAQALCGETTWVRATETL